MLYCQGYTVSFQEVPNEISLVLLVGDCPHRCPGCHSPELWEAKGEDLEANLDIIIDQYADVITCVCFMGDGNDYHAMERCFKRVQDRGFKAAIYSGYDVVAYDVTHLDYIKIGKYKQQLGGLGSPTTNQRMYTVKNMILSDCTDHFCRKELV